LKSAPLLDFTCALIITCIGVAAVLEIAIATFLFRSFGRASTCLAFAIPALIVLLVHWRFWHLCIRRAVRELDSYDGISANGFPAQMGLMPPEYRARAVLIQQFYLSVFLVLLPGIISDLAALWILVRLRWKAVDLPTLTAEQ
jgi:hypothetical protein